MKSKRWDILIFSLLFTGIGAAGGWYASAQKGQSAAGHEEEAEDAPAGESAPALSPQTLKNLRVSLGKAEKTTFTHYRSVPAVIERTPFNLQPVLAPIGGRIEDIYVEPGMVVRSGQSLLSLIRDPIPRPTLALTSSILKPAQEEIHRSVVTLRTARQEIKILQTEIERVSKYTKSVGGKELPILPRQTTIDLRYNLMRTNRSYELSSLELVKHGFTKEQISGIAEGGPIPDLGPEIWKRALEANGLWNDPAKELFEVLPEKIRSQRWTIATIGELAAAGLVSSELIEWLKSLPDSFSHFLEIGSLLEKGYSVADLRVLHQLNALEPVVEIQAPARGEIKDWDVRSLTVKRGSRVVSGDTLMALLDPRVMYLRTDPVGGEKGDILRSLSTGALCEARPLVGGSGPKLSGLKLSFVSSDSASRGMVAYAKVENTPLATEKDSAGRLLRSWKLREGLRYMLRVPISTMDNVFVLPSSAVTVDGPRRVVFLPDGETFRSVEVEIAYQNEEVAVIAINKDCDLFPGDDIVMTGAYGLGLALKDRPAKIDPHAGHSH